MAKSLFVTRVVIIALIGLVLGSQGCLVVYDGEKVIREGEAKRNVEFASETASEQFHTKFKTTKHTCMSNSSGREHLVIPFIACTNVRTKLSESACYNDALAAADTNGDNVITEGEARIYNECW